MKNRVLSIILSFGIVLSNFSSSFAVIAEDETEKTEPETTTVATETNTKPSTEEQSEAEVTSLQTEESSDAEPEESQDDEPVDKEVVEVKVVLNDNFPYSIYYGQNMPEFNKKSDVGLPEYYTLATTDGNAQVDIPEELYEYVSLTVTVGGEANPESDTEYPINLNIADDAIQFIDGRTYVIQDTLNKQFVVKGNYTFDEGDNIDIKISPNEDGVLCLSSSNRNYVISQSLDTTSFSTSAENYILKPKPNADGSYSYYLRNMNMESINYLAISKKMIYSDISKPQVESMAEISGDNLDLKKGYYNQSVVITLSGYAAASREAEVYFTLYNNNTILEEEIVANWVKVDQQGYSQYQAQYQIDIKENSSIVLNLSAIMTVDGQNSDLTSITLKQGRQIQNGTLTLENIPPTISYKTGYWNTVQFNANDYDSGVSNVVVTVFDNNGKRKVFESNENKYYYHYDLNQQGFNGKVTVTIEVTDKAGNTQTYIDSDKIVDGNPPEIKSVTFQYEITDGKWTDASSSVFHTYSYGRFANVPIRIVIEADDTGDETTYRGIETVELYNDTTRISSSYEKVMKTEDEVAYYYFDIDSCQYENLIVKVGDGNNYTYQEIGSMVIETQAPIGEIDKPSFSNHVNENNTDWYGIGIQDGKITIKVTDEQSGIAKVIIKDGNTILNPDEKDFTTNDKIEYSKEYYFPIKDTFKDGSHELSVEIVDNCGNNNSKNITLSFNTDFNNPSGTVSFVTDPKIIEIDGEKQNWFNGCGAESEKVVFALKISDDNPYKVVYSFINSESQAVYESNLLYITAEGEKVYEVEVNDAEAKIELEQKHYLDVCVTFIDQAGNSSTYDDETGHHEIVPVRFYKDLGYPTINSVSVSKTETGLDKVLRVLSFGIYSNNNINYTVEASDIEFDSGLANNSVIISFGETEYVMTRDSKNTYSYEVKAGDERVLSGEIAVTVTDRYGLKAERTIHYSKDFDVIHGTSKKPYFTLGKSETESRAFMIDKNSPTVKFEPLVSDGRERNDGTIWVKDDHDVKFTVTDFDSGLSSIMVIVNGDMEHPLTADSDSKKFLTEEETSNYSTIDDVKTSEIYRLSTDNLMEAIKASDGHYIIEVIVTDYAGNQNEEAIIDYYIDKEAPIVGKIEFSIPSADDLSEGEVTDATQYIENLQYGYYFKTDLVATVNITDKAPSSELNEIEYILVDYNNGVKGDEHPGRVAITSEPHPGNGTADSIGTASFLIPANFKGQILVTAYDYVGNESVERTPDLFVIDTPEKHESEEHISISGLGTSSYTDSEGHALFDTNVNLTVTITDTMSGIRDISYAINSEQDTQDKRTITINNTGNSVGQDLGDGWTITAMDENLITEITRNYTFSADDNNIQLSFAMTDRANNTSDRTSDIFSIDQTEPVINVAFDTPAGNNDYYRENRTATITVIERNFDASLINAAITNEIGGTPILSFASHSNTEHVATLIFGEGDYTFGIEGADRANHTAIVNYSGGNEKSFHVDMTSPTEIDNFDQFINELNNSFNFDKEMTFTITEHNFVPSQVNIRVYRTAAGNELTTENREDCTSEYVSVEKWTSTGDKHIISFKFTEDYVYQVTIIATDASGRTLSEKASPVFEIDKTAPVLKTPKNLDVLVFTNKNTETSATPLEFFDANIASIHYSVVSYQMKLNEDNIGYDMNVDSDEFDVKSDEVVISNEFFNQDGIYEVKSVAYDVAGNKSNETTHTFVIQRDTDFLVYIPNSIKANQTGLYKFNEKGIRSADFEDIEIITYITQDKELEIQVDGNIVEAGDLDVNKDDRRINQVDMYDVTLKNSYISQNYNADTIDTDLTLNAVATDGDTEQVITLGHIYIDNVKPVGEYESALQNLGTFDGFYGMESRTVLIEGVSPDIDVDRCEIQLNDTTLKNEDGGFVYDENAHTISFTIDKGYTDIKPTLVDKAGNINNLAMVKNVYVGGIFARWWYLFIFGGLAVLAIPTAIVIVIIKKKRKPFLF